MLLPLRVTLVVRLFLLLQSPSSFSTLCSALASPIPITVLSGFLGAGKTTLLQQLLHNEEGLRIAIVVNDMATVNIDSKQVTQRRTIGDGDDSGTSMRAMVQLQNGCACCAQSEELLGSVAELLTQGDMREDTYDHIVIEMSGIADPGAVRAKFQEALMYDMPIMERVQLDTMITLVDSSTFWHYFRSEKVVSEAPELVRDVRGQDDLDDDVIPLGLLQTLGSAPSTQHEEDSAISSILIAQVEVADVLLLNKVDLVDETSSMEEMLQALNPQARIFGTEYGRLPCHEVLGSAKAQGVVASGIIDDHKDSVKHASEVHQDHHSHGQHEHATEHDSHSHNQHSHDDDDNDGHDHHHNHASSNSNNSHSHSHADDDNKAHGHHHNHASSDSKTPTHDSHSHDHHDDPDCTDDSHSHSHDHHVGNIGSFVYRARRPFHPDRLAAWLQHLPVVQQQQPVIIPMTEGVDAATRAALQRVVRSKGFYWQADSHAAALYWSHAGSALDLSCIGGWWATLPRYRWPAASVNDIVADFDDPEHNDEDVDCNTVGDRRQELVFIGSSLGNENPQALISRSLDTCLLTDEEWDLYSKTKFDEDSLRTTFHSPLEVQMMSF